MNKDHTANPDHRRRHLVVGLCALGTGLGVARYLAGRAQVPSGHPTPVDFADLPPSKLLTVDWNGRPIWILRRTADEVAALADRESELIDPDSGHSLQPSACRNRHRSLRPEIFVAIGLCTHQGCTPQLRDAFGARSVFLCPCHTSRFDLAGRVFRGGPAPSNLLIPEYRLESDGRVLIGEA